MIKVENISKQYRIGAKQQKAGTLAEAMSSFLLSPVRNLRRLRGLTTFKQEEEDDVIWALKDVSFEVKEGEVVGIIGRNGAGKSTLLKVLSRITPPTRGRVQIDGRVSSLLEVGTGFHPELTGRENIYLNGTILGMRKHEVDRKFNEIVDFSGIEKFIDTPVKRYSSGMSVRLAFSVAAHLEPEVLIIDEVLAVGDLDFQKKCLGKMSKVSSEGRTVLFVSHNMQAVRSLCKRVMLLDSGKIVLDGNADKTISGYINEAAREVSAKWNSDVWPGDEHLHLKSIIVSQEGSNGSYQTMTSEKPINVLINCHIHKYTKNLVIGYDLFNSEGILLWRSYHVDYEEEDVTRKQKGDILLTSIIPSNILKTGEYYIAPRIGVHNEFWIVHMDPVVAFNVFAGHARSRFWHSGNTETKPGVIAPLVRWVSTQK